MGDTIASEMSEKSTPKLDVEEELRLAAELGANFKVNNVAQEMKDLGLERLLVLRLFFLLGFRVFS